MKKIIVIASQLGRGKAEGTLFLIDMNGETIIVNREFAKANGIDENYRGLVLYKDQFCKKGDTYTDKEGKPAGTYSKDHYKITQLIATEKAEGSKFMETYNSEMIKKELYGAL